MFENVENLKTVTRFHEEAGHPKTGRPQETDTKKNDSSSVALGAGILFTSILYAGGELTLAAGI